MVEHLEHLAETPLTQLFDNLVPVTDMIGELEYIVSIRIVEPVIKRVIVPTHFLAFMSDVVNIIVFQDFSQFEISQVPLVVLNHLRRFKRQQLVCVPF